MFDESDTSFDSVSRLREAIWASAVCSVLFDCPMSIVNIGVRSVVVVDDIIVSLEPSQSPKTSSTRLVNDVTSDQSTVGVYPVGLTVARGQAAGRSTLWSKEASASICLGWGPSDNVARNWPSYSRARSVDAISDQTAAEHTVYGKATRTTFATTTTYLLSRVHHGGSSGQRAPPW